MRSQRSKASLIIWQAQKGARARARSRMRQIGEAPFIVVSVAVINIELANRPKSS